MNLKTFSGRMLYFMLALVFLAPLNSCKKDNDNNTNQQTGTYVMRFKANGTEVKYTTQQTLSASFTQSGSQYIGVFTGYTATSNMSLQVYDGKAIEESTYSGYELADSAFVGALIAYQDDSGTTYTQGGANPNTTITITEITSNTIRGTFSGTVKASGKPDIAITDGAFYVKRFN